MKKHIVFILIIGCFCNCTKDEVTPAIEQMPIQLTTFNMDHFASISPDGKNIVFKSGVHTEFLTAEVNFELWIMGRYGENPRLLFSRVDMVYGDNIRMVRWSSNSDYITILVTSRFHNNKKSEIWKVALNGEKTKLHSFDFIMENLSYSPDGTKTAFIFQGPVDSYGSPVYNLYSANTNYTDTILIEKGLIADYDWTKDSETLLYSLYDRPNEKFDLLKIRFDGTGKTKLTENTEFVQKFQCSKTDNQIVYSFYNKVYVSSFDNFAPKLVMENVRSPNWVPNRKLISLISEQSLDGKTWTESWIVDLNGNVIRKVAEGEPSQVYFSVMGDYFVFNASGNLWLDYLPW